MFYWLFSVVVAAIVIDQTLLLFNGGEFPKHANIHEYTKALTKPYKGPNPYLVQERRNIFEGPRAIPKSKRNRQDR